jgi:hypothetical protein
VRTAAIGAAVVAFLALSALVARVIGAGSTARTHAVDAIKHQRAATRGGTVRILRVEGVGGFAIGGRTETARIAWRAGSRLPVVQCVRVRRTDDPFSGYGVHTLSVSRPIGREADCPS